MKQLIIEHLPEIISALVGLLLSAIGTLVAWLQYRKKVIENRQLKSQLQKAREAGIYTYCPGCGCRIMLKDLHFYLPGEFPDDDLDCKPDK